MGNQFLERLAAGERLISDGATGTNLQMDGLEPGQAPETWITEAPEKILKLHRDFVASGADLILTNTFGASGLRLGEESDQACALNRRAAQLARQAAEEGEQVLVGGSMGPTGSMMEPLGPLTYQAAVETYVEQARNLQDGGVDLLVVETMFDLKEAQAAVEGAQRGADLPIVCSFSFDRGKFTMMGVSPEKMVETLRPLGLAAMGANCGHSLEMSEQVLTELIASDPGVPLWIKPNAGMPRPGTNPPEFDTSPEDMAAFLARFAEAGAQILGGCCGTSAEHLKAIAAAVRA